MYVTLQGGSAICDQIFLFYTKSVNGREDTLFCEEGGCLEIQKKCATNYSNTTDAVVLPSGNQLLDLWFPYKKDENDDALDTINKIAQIKYPRCLKYKRNHLHSPRGSHDDKQTNIKKEPRITSQ